MVAVEDPFAKKTYLLRRKLRGLDLRDLMRDLMRLKKNKKHKYKYKINKNLYTCVVHECDTHVYTHSFCTRTETEKQYNNITNTLVIGNNGSV